MISNWLPILPIIVTMLTAIGSFSTWYKPKYQRWVSVAGSALLTFTALFILPKVLAANVLVSHLGNWVAPFGISFVLDPFSIIMILLSGIAGLAVAIYSVADLNPQQISSGFYPAYSILLIGLCGAFTTADLFNLYVWFEVTVISSFVLMACGNGRFQLDGTLKYAIMNLIATLFLLIAIALLYGVSGTLNMADLAVRLTEIGNAGLVTAIIALLIIAFAMKAALFPLFFWMPASYHTPSFSSSAIFAAMLSKLGVYALIRMTSLLTNTHGVYLHNVLLVLALSTLIIGVLGALVQKNIRRLLSFTLISHIGFIIVGLALFTPIALAAAIFYLIQHVIVKTQLFMMAGTIRRLTGTEKLNKMGNLYKNHPWISLCFILPALALAGVPPLSGFWGKLGLISASIKSHAYISALIMIAVSLLTLWVIIQAWLKAFLKDNPNPLEPSPMTQHDKMVLMVPIVGLSIITLIISFFPKPLFHLSLIASHCLLNSQQYIQAVLGGIK
ncbi:MAG: Na+/H+ antiporter subunit D [Legionellaceae bacterium]|nr:Na+/H+ antiporter subunit D [Legionellaceae bacterium]|tara:strand:- start:356 stop:1858 length:1503 start_codon:yes stop_codon:yes gene_type:complete